MLFADDDDVGSVVDVVASAVAAGVVTVVAFASFVFVGVVAVVASWLLLFHVSFSVWLHTQYIHLVKRSGAVREVAIYTQPNTHTQTLCSLFCSINFQKNHVCISNPTAFTVRPQHHNNTFKSYTNHAELLEDNILRKCLFKWHIRVRMGVRALVLISDVEWQISVCFLDANAYGKLKTDIHSTYDLVYLQCSSKVILGRWYRYIAQFRIQVTFGGILFIICGTVFDLIFTAHLELICTFRFVFRTFERVSLRDQCRICLPGWSFPWILSPLYSGSSSNRWQIELNLISPGKLYSN